MIREFINNTEAFLGIVIALPLILGLLIGAVAIIIISLIWGILALIGMIVVIFAGIIIIYKQIKIGVIMMIIGICLVIASTVFGLETGVVDMSNVPVARFINSLGG